MIYLILMPFNSFYDIIIIVWLFTASALKAPAQYFECSRYLSTFDLFDVILNFEIKFEF